MEATQKVRVDVDSLKEGMYVSELDRPWTETTFPFQGFLLRNPRDIQRVRQYCQYVYVDVLQSIATGGFDSFGIPMVVERSKAVGSEKQQAKIDAKVLDINKPTAAKAMLARGGKLSELPPREPTVGFASELLKAREVYRQLREEAMTFFEAADQGRPVSAAPLLSCMADVISSMARNENALEWVSHSGDDDMCVAQHCISVSIMSIKLGRHIGLSDRFLRVLGVAGLVFDVGKLIISEDIRNKTSKLTPEEMAVMQKHAKVGAELLEETGKIPPEVINVCARHHERIDGNGYPQHLQGEDIDLLTRIVSITDTYTAISRAGYHKPGFSPSYAMEEITRHKGTYYDADLVEAFTRCNGTFPVGTLIETMTGEVGIVAALNPRFKLSPSVMMVLDADKNELDEIDIIDFAEELDGNGKRRYSIKKALERGSHGVNPVDYF